MTNRTSAHPCSSGGLFSAAARAALLLTLCFGAMACGTEETTSTTRSPRVRVFEVGEESQGQARTVSGRLAAADRSPVSFGVSGTIDSVLVDQGDKVRENQVLATLDTQPIRRTLERARSDVSANRAKLVEAEKSYSRASALLREQVGSRADVDIAEANVKSARAVLRGSQSKVEDGERDLRRAELRSPFAGRVSERSIEPFQEVSANEPAFVIQGGGALLVQARVAESVIRHVDYAQQVRVAFPTLPDLELIGAVSQIAAQAGAGNAFPIEVQLPNTDADLRPGMTATITLNYAEYLDSQTAFLIPLSAVAIDVGLLTGRSANDNVVPVFVFDEAEGKARVKNVRLGGLRGNRLEVFEGLEAGDLVISAGVSFLHDGMDVRRWSSTLDVNGG